MDTYFFPRKVQTLMVRRWIDLTTSRYLDLVVTVSQH